MSVATPGRDVADVAGEWKKLDAGEQRNSGNTDGVAGWSSMMITGEAPTNYTPTSWMILSATSKLIR